MLPSGFKLKSRRGIRRHRPSLPFQILRYSCSGCSRWPVHMTPYLRSGSPCYQGLCRSGSRSYTPVYRSLRPLRPAMRNCPPVGCIPPPNFHFQPYRCRKHLPVRLLTVSNALQPHQSPTLIPAQIPRPTWTPRKNTTPHTVSPPPLPASLPRGHRAPSAVPLRKNTVHFCCHIFVPVRSQIHSSRQH